MCLKSRLRLEMRWERIYKSLPLGAALRGELPARLSLVFAARVPKLAAHLLPPDILVQARVWPGVARPRSEWVKKADLCKRHGCGAGGAEGLPDCRP